MVDPFFTGRLFVTAAQASMHCAGLVMCESLSLMTRVFETSLAPAGAGAAGTAPASVVAAGPATRAAPTPWVSPWYLATDRSADFSPRAPTTAVHRSSPADFTIGAQNAWFDMWRTWTSAMMPPSGAMAATPAMATLGMPSPAIAMPAWSPQAMGWGIGPAAMPAMAHMMPSMMSAMMPWLTSCASRLQPADMWRAMMPGGAQPAWPIAFALIGMGLPRDMAWPAAEFGTTVTRAAQGAMDVAGQAFATAYRSDGGHATAHVIRATPPPAPGADRAADAWPWLLPPWSMMGGAMFGGRQAFDRRA